MSSPPDRRERDHVGTDPRCQGPDRSNHHGHPAVGGITVVFVGVRVGNVAAAGMNYHGMSRPEAPSIWDTATSKAHRSARNVEPRVAHATRHGAMLCGSSVEERRAKMIVCTTSESVHAINSMSHAAPRSLTDMQSTLNVYSMVRTRTPPWPPSTAIPPPQRAHRPRRLGRRATQPTRPLLSLPRHRWHE